MKIRTPPTEAALNLHILYYKNVLLVSLSILNSILSEIINVGKNEEFL